MNPHDKIKQDDETNPLVGAEGRAELLRSLGQALELHPEFFSSALAEGNGEEGEGKEAVFRPGYLVDYLYAKADPGTKEVRCVGLGGWLCVVIS